MHPGDRKERIRMQKTDSTLLVGMHEAAQRMGLGLSTVKALVQRNELRSITVGKRRLIPITALEAFVARRLAAIT
jgi:excisionase family DNA binding protein